jgi:hypothetical protein
LLVLSRASGDFRFGVLFFFGIASFLQIRRLSVLGTQPGSNPCVAQHLPLTLMLGPFNPLIMLMPSNADGKPCDHARSLKLVC